MEELKNLDLKQLNQNSKIVDNQKIEQSQANSFEADKASFIKDDDNQEIEIKNKELKSAKDEIDKSFEINSYEIAKKESNENKALKPLDDNKSQPKIEALIPLPPNPKYSYLKKWLLRK